MHEGFGQGLDRDVAIQLVSRANDMAHSFSPMGGRGDVVDGESRAGSENQG
jgi:hypothetical protein